jgi:hypothetical protein
MNDAEIRSQEHDFEPRYSADPSVPSPQQPIEARLSHLQRLGAESLRIMRDVLAECERPVLPHAIGKDSPVMPRPAPKAFFPVKPPFPLLHIDASPLPLTIREMRLTRLFESRDRVIDYDQVATIEKKKVDGYL